MQPRVLGLDLSLTGTGLATFSGEGWRTRAVGTSSKQELPQRLRHIVDELEVFMGGDGCDLAVIEDLPRGARGSSSVGMVHGVVRLQLAATPVLLVTPASLKVFAANSGRAEKKDVAREARRVLGLDGQLTFDEYDAAWLVAVGLHLLCDTTFAVPVQNLRALDGVQVSLQAQNVVDRWCG